MFRRGLVVALSLCLRLVLAQTRTNGLAVLSAPQPNAQFNSPGTLSLALDLSAAPASAFISLSAFLTGGPGGGVNLAVGNGNLVQQEVGSTVKHVSWTMPGCLMAGGYQLVINEETTTRGSASTTIPINIVSSNPSASNSDPACRGNAAPAREESPAPRPTTTSDPPARPASTSSKTPEPPSTPPPTSSSAREPSSSVERATPASSVSSALSLIRSTPSTQPTQRPQTSTAYNSVASTASTSTATPTGSSEAAMNASLRWSSLGSGTATAMADSTPTIHGGEEGGNDYDDGSDDGEVYDKGWSEVDRYTVTTYYEITKTVLTIATSLRTFSILKPTATVTIVPTETAERVFAVGMIGYRTSGADQVVGNGRGLLWTLLATSLAIVYLL